MVFVATPFGKVFSQELQLEGLEIGRQHFTTVDCPCAELYYLLGEKHVGKQPG